MGKKELFWELAAKAVKTLVALFILFAIAYFVESLPYARSLYFVDQRLPVSVFLDALVSLLAVAVFIRFGVESSPAAAGLLDFMPEAGTFWRSALKILALLFSYFAFQGAVFPFIAGYEWAYQSVFLGFTLFFLARAGLQAYASSEAISRFLIAALRDPAGAAAPAPDPAEKK